jgi:hypothetical protein
MDESITSLEDITQEQVVSPFLEVPTSLQTSAAKDEIIKDAKKELLDSRTISKKHDQKGRDAVAQQLYDTRQQKSQNTLATSESEKRLEELVDRVETKAEQERQLSEDVANRMSTLIVRVKTALKIPDRQAAQLQSDLTGTHEGMEDLYTEIYKIEDEVASLRKEQEALPGTRTLVEAYYAKMETEPLSNEEKRILLTPEVLSSLTMDEYTALWKRLNPHFLSHITRQGFRDHNAMTYHSGGLQEFHNGFIDIMEDDRLLRPPLALNGLKNRDRVSVEEWMDTRILKAEDADTAKQRLDAILHKSMASAPVYPDKTAVHLATQAVADSYYGGETGNEVFFIYPSDALASQNDFAFNGGEKDFTQPQSEMKWNDVFIWPPSLENPGIPVDAGIVFLPNSTLVDRTTGSKYASEVVMVEGKERNVMIEDVTLVSAYIKWGAVLNDKSSRVWKAFEEYKNASYDQQEYLEQELLQGISQELKDLGFTDDAALTLSIETRNAMYGQREYTEENLLRIIHESGAQYARAKETVTAKDYWESVFTANPQIRPKHVVYYDGSPTDAVLEFQQKHGIGAADTSAKEGKLLGFDDHHIVLQEKGDVPDPDNRSMRGHDDLVALAEKIIKERYKIPK